MTDEHFYMLPERVAEMLETNEIASSFDFAFLAWLGTKYDAHHGGLLTNKATIAALLRCSKKTVQRMLRRLRDLGLIQHDLRQGMTNFTVALGPRAVVEGATLDSLQGGRVQSDLGHPSDDRSSRGGLQSAIQADSTLDSRARKSVSEEVSSEGRRTYKSFALDDELDTPDSREASS